MNNLGLRSLSVLIAVLLWLYVTSDNNVTSARIPVSVDVRELPVDKVVVWQLKKQVDVEVRGPSFLVNRLIATPPTLRLKIPDTVENKFTAHITRAELDIEPPMQVLSIEPSTISFSVEQKISKELQVKVPLIGQLKTDLQLDHIKVSPGSVTLVGPESEVKDLAVVQTIPVDLRDVKESFTDEISLQIPGTHTESDRPQVKVKFSISVPDVKKQIVGIPIEIRQSGDMAALLKPQVVTITVISTQSKIDSIKDGDIIPYVRLPRTIDGKGTLVPVQVELPSGLKLSSVEPEKVTITQHQVPEISDPSRKTATKRR